MVSTTAPMKAQSPTRSPGQERRASVRWRSIPPGETWITFDGPVETLDALMLDLSISGIGLVLPRRPGLGTFLVIGLTSCRRPLTLQLVARVVRAMPRSDGSWIVGCAFDTLLSPDELEALL